MKETKTKCKLESECSKFPPWEFVDYSLQRSILH